MAVVDARRTWPSLPSAHPALRYDGLEKAQGIQMRSTLVVLLAALLASGNLGAQSLEESYGKLCFDPSTRDSELCLTLQKTLAARRQDNDQDSVIPLVNASEAQWRARWGVYMDYIGKDWFMRMSKEDRPAEAKATLMNYITRITWLVPGDSMTYTVVMGDGKAVKMATLHWDEAEKRIVWVNAFGGADVYLIAQPDGSVVHVEQAVPGLGRVRGVSRLLPDGSIQIISEVNKDGSWRASESSMAERTPDLLARERRLLQEFEVQRTQRHMQQLADERAAKAANNAQRARMVGAVLQGVGQGLSDASGADAGGYAEAQANLDATVANINDAAAMERQQQAQAEQQAQARAAEEQRQQLAANARWVAEKEQAAAEYRSAQVEAAAAREEARVLAANAEAEAERVRRAEAQRQQAAADANGSVADQKPPASGATNILGGATESGRGGSTCNEELACRKTCVGDVFAVTECVKQCARESACRVGIQ